jgi:hypothetical protein
VAVKALENYNYAKAFSLYAQALCEKSVLSLPECSADSNFPVLSLPRPRVTYSMYEGRRRPLAIGIHEGIVDDGARW